MRVYLAIFLQTFLAVHVFSQSSESTTIAADSTGGSTESPATDASVTTVDPTATTVSAETTVSGATAVSGETTVDSTATTVSDASATTVDPTATTVSGATAASGETTVDPTATTVSGATAVSGETTVDSTATTVSGATGASEETSSDAQNSTEAGSTTPEGPQPDCYLCAPTVQCGETIEGDYSSAEVNVLFMKAMEDGDFFTVKGEVFENAEKIYFDIFKDLSVGKAQVGGNSQPTLLQFEHYYDTNLTFSRSGLQGNNEWDSFRPATLPLPIRQKLPWTLMFRMHKNLTGFETGDETGWFNNHIPWNGTATTQSFNIRGNWKTTSVTYVCANSSIPIL